MSFFKFTIFAGRNKAGEIVSCSRNGHWKAETITRAARKSGIVGSFQFTHAVGDTSGRGRGGHDGRFQVDAQNNVTQIADWSEFGKEHA